MNCLIRVLQRLFPGTPGASRPVCDSSSGRRNPGQQDVCLDVERLERRLLFSVANPWDIVFEPINGTTNLALLDPTGGKDGQVLLWDSGTYKRIATLDWPSNLSATR